VGCFSLVRTGHIPVGLNCGIEGHENSGVREFMNPLCALSRINLQTPGNRFRTASWIYRACSGAAFVLPGEISGTLSWPRIQPNSAARDVVYRRVAYGWATIQAQPNSRTLRRLSGVIPTKAHTRLSMSCLARCRQSRDRSASMPTLSTCRRDASSLRFVLHPRGTIVFAIGWKALISSCIRC